jgi:hypothetical protein
VNLSIGQQRHRFTRDRSVSSGLMGIMGRSVLAYRMGFDYALAVALVRPIRKLD